jgi:hypothetical protein
MVVGTLFTLFVVPVFYSFIATEHKRSDVDKVLDDEASEVRGEVVPVA